MGIKMEIYHNKSGNLPWLKFIRATIALGEHYTRSIIPFQYSQTEGFQLKVRTSSEYFYTFMNLTLCQPIAGVVQSIG